MSPRDPFGVLADLNRRHPVPPPFVATSLSALRVEVQRWPVDRALYRLCLEHPPLDPATRPRVVRWILYDAGNYPHHARAYAAGLAGAPMPPDLGRWAWRAAYLAGIDARAATV